jgi:hypothetical protein
MTEEIIEERLERVDTCATQKVQRVGGKLRRRWVLQVLVVTSRKNHKSSVEIERCRKLTFIFCPGKSNSARPLWHGETYDLAMNRQLVVGTMVDNKFWTGFVSEITPGVEELSVQFKHPVLVHKPNNKSSVSSQHVKCR